MKKFTNCLLLCLLIALSNMVQTSSIASQMKTNNKINTKNIMSFMEKNHDLAKDADAAKQNELMNENLGALKKLLAHFQEKLEKEGEKDGEKLKDMVADLKKDVAGMEKMEKKMKAYIAKMMKEKLEAMKANEDREVAIQKIHEQATELTNKMTDMDEIRELNHAFDDHLPAGGFDKVNEECKKLTAEEKKKEVKHKEEKDNSFLQTKGEKLDAASDGAGVAKACTAGFMSAFPPTFAFKRGGDFGVSSFKADGYSRQGAMYYKHCNPGYKVVLGVCWKSCGSGYTDFGATCTRCEWRKKKHRIFWSTVWLPYLWCHTHGKHSYITHQLTFFDHRVKCANDKHYKGGALCYRDCKYNSSGDVDTMINCGIGACATSTGACVAGVLNLAAELILGMIQLVAFVASFGAAGAGANQAAGSGARKMLSAAGNKAKHAWASAKRLATDAVFRETTKKAVVKSAKKKMAEDFGNAALGKYIEVQCRRLADDLLNDMKDKNDYDLKNLDFTGITAAAAACQAGSSNDKINSDVACARGIFAVLSNVDPTGLSTLAAAVLQPSIER